jgi:hypothetical protein
MSIAPIKYGEHPKVPPGTPCETCGGTKKQPITDHCHEHGWVRGLICGSCNRLMSFIDKRIAPKVESAHLAALVALWQRCPECGQLGAPKLSPPPVIDTKNINLRLDPDLHSWLVGRAAREHRSINGHIEHLLEQDRSSDPAGGDRRTVLVGDTYVTPEEAAQYAEEEAVADEVFGRGMPTRCAPSSTRPSTRPSTETREG